MQTLELIGKVQPDTTRQLRIPGRDDLIVAPDDWPMQLALDTLTVQINDDGFPDGFEEIGDGDGLKKLDEGKFRPTFVVPARLIAGNTLQPTGDDPTRGFASVWRAELQVLTTGERVTCWMLFLIGSDNASQIELVAEEHLRNRLSLSDGTPVKVTVYEAESNWEPKTPNEVITDWCEAVRGIEDDYGTEKAMGYLIGEKFLTFLEVAETDSEWREAIPAFVAEIKALFEPWQFAQYLDTPRRLGVLGHTADDERHRMLRQALDESEKAREDARNLILLEWARELLLEDIDQ